MIKKLPRNSQKQNNYDNKSFRESFSKQGAVNHQRKQNIHISIKEEGTGIFWHLDNDTDVKKPRTILRSDLKL